MTGLQGIIDCITPPRTYGEHISARWGRHCAIYCCKTDSPSARPGPSLPYNIHLQMALTRPRRRQPVYIYIYTRWYLFLGNPSCLRITDITLVSGPAVFLFVEMFTHDTLAYKIKREQTPLWLCAQSAFRTMTHGGENRISNSKQMNILEWKMVNGLMGSTR